MRIETRGNEEMYEVFIEEVPAYIGKIRVVGQAALNLKAGRIEKDNVDFRDYNICDGEILNLYTYPQFPGVCYLQPQMERNIMMGVPYGDIGVLMQMFDETGGKVGIEQISEEWNIDGSVPAVIVQ